MAKTPTIIVTGMDGILRLLPEDAPLAAGTPEQDNDAVTLGVLQELIDQYNQNNQQTNEEITDG
jgi:hypothetical protein